MMSCITGYDVLSIAALGRPFHLGMLYDCRSDKLIPGITLWDKNNLDKKSVQTQETANFEVITSDSLENKTYALDLNAGLKLSFLGGQLDISGSGEYLESRKSSSHHERITLKYKCTTRSEEMTMEQLGKGNMQHPEVFEKGIATHVVTGITYGVNAFFVFDRKVSSESDRREVHGRLQALVTKIPKFDISGNGDLKLSDDDKNEVEKIHCRYYGDFLPRENPSTFRDAVNLYRMLPDLLGENKEKAVPIKVQLYPLVLLDSKGCKLERDISIILVRETEVTFESLFALELRCNDLLESETVKKFRSVLDEIQRFLSLLKTYRLELQEEVSMLLPKIRGGGKEEAELANILEKDKMSPFSQNALVSYIQGLERNLKVLSQFTNALSIVRFTEPEDLESSIISHASMLCFSILIPRASFCLDEMKKYLKRETCKTAPPLDVGNDSENPAKISRGTLATMRKANHFVEFFKANINSDIIAFIVSYKHSDSREFGSEINYFHDGELLQQDFDIPTAPGKPFSDDTDITDSSIVVKWNPPSSGAAKIVKYKVHYNKIHEDNMTFELDAGLSNNGYQIKNLKPACDYIVCIQGVFEEGAIICSVKSDPIKTKPATQEGEHAKSELCKLSNVIEESKTLIIYQPQLVIKYEDNNKMLRELQLGSPSQKTEEKVIMLLGATGSGKTTLINGLINYIFGVQWDDPFRFELIPKIRNVTQAFSQITQICIYTIYHQEGSRVPYNLTIIDTPGVWDIIDIVRNAIITNKIRDLFRTEGSYGIDHLDAVCFVASSSNPRLTPTHKCIFNHLLRIFGKDITDNIFILFTFCDGQTPQVLSEYKDANIPFQDYFKFNNSALYSCKDRGGSSKFDAMFWQMGAESFETFLEVLKRTSSKSLLLTENVSGRESLEFFIRKMLNSSLNKSEQLEK